MASCLFDHKQTEILDEYGRHLLQSMKGVIRSGHKVMNENIEVMCWKEKDKVVTAYLHVRANDTSSAFPAPSTLCRGSSLSIENTLGLHSIPEAPLTIGRATSQGGEHTVTNVKMTAPFSTCSRNLGLGAGKTQVLGFNQTKM